MVILMKDTCTLYICLDRCKILLISGLHMCTVFVLFKVVRIGILIEHIMKIDQTILIYMYVCYEQSK